MVAPFRLWVPLRISALNGKINEPKKDDQPLGIGISNVEKRLDLLYPGKHDFVITSEDEVFIVNLKIELEQKKETLIKQVTTAQEVIHA